jgi:hypothetical protein
MKFSATLVVISILNVTACSFAYAQDYGSNLASTGDYIATQQLSDGAILYSPTQIDPYFANLAAIGWLKDNSTNRIPAVEAWMSWYISHFNWPDYNGIYGTVYNYNVNNRIETSTQSYDSADSYAATFLTLAENLWNTGDAGAQSFLKGIGWYDFDVVGNVITNLQQSDGLVIAKPDYAIKYTMDNAEDYRGLSDVASLAVQAFNNSTSEAWYNVHASNVQNGVQSYLRISGSNLYLSYLGASAPNLNKWYPDTVSQLWPINNGVIQPNGSQAKSIYSQFKSAWPDWYNLSFNSQDPFPWCAVSYTAYLEGDTSAVNSYILAMQSKYVSADPSFRWPFHSGEGGWFMRTNAVVGGLP